MLPFFFFFVLTDPSDPGIERKTLTNIATQRNGLVLPMSEICKSIGHVSSCCFLIVHSMNNFWLLLSLSILVETQE